MVILSRFSEFLGKDEHVQSRFGRGVWGQHRFRAKAGKRLIGKVESGLFKKNATCYRDVWEARTRA
jgi:hypothetical protein